MPADDQNGNDKGVKDGGANIAPPIANSGQVNASGTKSNIVKSPMVDPSLKSISEKPQAQESSKPAEGSRPNGELKLDQTKEGIQAQSVSKKNDAGSSFPYGSPV
jgi:hypothetical protein